MPAAAAPTWPHLTATVRTGTGMVLATSAPTAMGAGIPLPFAPTTSSLRSSTRQDVRWTSQRRRLRAPNSRTRPSEVLRADRLIPYASKALGVRPAWPVAKLTQHAGT